MDKYEREKYRKRQALRKKKKQQAINRLLTFILVALVAAIVLYLVISRQQQGQTEVQSQVTQNALSTQDSFSIEDLPVDTTAAAEVITSETVNVAKRAIYEGTFLEHFKVGSAYLVDDLGNVLYAQDENERNYPASTTKLMTMILALENVEDLDEIVTIGTLYSCYEEDSMLFGLSYGDRISMRDLLYGMIIMSYNDFAAAIGIEIGGSIEAFADMMNAKAAELGMNNSHFVNPHGLYNEDHYMTAHDLNLLVQEASKYDFFLETQASDSRTITLLYDGWEQTYEITNKNYFHTGEYNVSSLTFLGGKTGYIPQSHSSYASVFTDGERTYYCAILSSADSPYMTALLLDYMFEPESMASLLEITPILSILYGYYG